jgi:hypothetical protein
VLTASGSQPFCSWLFVCGPQISTSGMAKIIVPRRQLS